VTASNGRAWVLAALLALAARPGGADEDPLAERLRAATALVQAGRLDEADDLLLSLADEAGTRGRTDVEAEALREALDLRAHRFDLIGLHDVAARLLECEERTGRPAAAARTALDLAWVETDLGHARRAVGRLDAALGRLEAHEPALVPHAHARLGHAYLALGRYSEALQHAEAAVSRQRHALGEAVAADLESITGLRLDLATFLRVVGNAYSDLGEQDLARRAYEEALPLVDPGDPFHDDLEANLGVAAYRSGRFDEARERLETALAAYRARGEHGAAGRALSHLARAHLAAGRPEETLPLTAEAASLGLPPARAYAGIAAGQALLALGRPAEAAVTFADALERGRALGDRDLAGAAYAGLAAARLAAGDATGAVGAAREALAAVHEVVAGTSPLETASARALRTEVFAVGAKAAFILGDPAIAFEFLERGRADAVRRVLGGREALGTAALPRDLAVEEEAARERLNAARARYDAAAESRHLRRLTDATAALATAHLDYEAVLRHILRRPDPRVDAAFPALFTPDEVAARLGPGEALVLYSTEGVEAHALVLRPGVQARSVDLGPSAPLTEAAAALAVTRDGAEVVVSMAGALASLLVRPLGLGAEVRRIVVCPDGQVATVPFALLLPDHEVVLAPSAGTYTLLGAPGRRRGGDLLAVGDPEYERTEGGVALRVYGGGRPLGRLPEARREVQRIGRRPGDLVLLGAAATEDAVRRALERRPWWAAVHFACHGILHPQRPGRSALALTPAPPDDGFLSVAEIYGLRIRCDLVVLSACSTADGGVFRGEGLVGLTQAFLIAGAPRVLGSLWDVDDEATRAFMEAFYAKWREGLATAAAVREAQGVVRRRWPHPRYWAAWVLWGRPE
jgi:tetratricopeptide (TPR) repeat protein